MVIDPFTLLLAFLFLPKAKRTPGSSPRLDEPSSAGMSVFPVSIEAASFSDDYHAEAVPGGPRKHLGVDIFAPAGTAVLAPEAGRVRFTTDPKGGNVFYLKGRSGTSYYGAHLMGFYGGDAGSSRTVRAGDQIGWVGQTGNASSTAPHLHFQMSGGKVNPYPALHALAPNAPVAPWARGVA